MITDQEILEILQIFQSDLNKLESGNLAHIKTNLINGVQYLIDELKQRKVSEWIKEEINDYIEKKYFQEVGEKWSELNDEEFVAWLYDKSHGK